MKRILFSIFCILLIPTFFAEAGISDKNDKLIQAAEKGNLQEVQAALAEGADINGIVIMKKHGMSVKGPTPLKAASRNGHTEVVKYLLNKGAEINAKANTTQSTALMIASENGYTEIVRILLDKGADVNVKAKIDNVEYTALKMAKKNGHKEVVEILERAGAKE